MALQDLHDQIAAMLATLKEMGDRL